MTKMAVTCQHLLKQQIVKEKDFISLKMWRTDRPTCKQSYSWRSIDKLSSVVIDKYSLMKEDDSWVKNYVRKYVPKDIYVYILY